MVYLWFTDCYTFIKGGNPSEYFLPEIKFNRPVNIMTRTRTRTRLDNTVLLILKSKLSFVRMLNYWRVPNVNERIVCRKVHMTFRRLSAILKKSVCFTLEQSHTHMHESKTKAFPSNTKPTIGNVFAITINLCSVAHLSLDNQIFPTLSLSRTSHWLKALLKK